MAFMALNWLLTLHLVVASAFSLCRLLLSAHHVISLSECTAFIVVAVFLFLLQNYLLLVALFCRLFVLYESGPLRLSKRTSCLYIAVLCVIPMLCLGVPVTRGLGAGKTERRILSLAIIGSDVLVLMALLSLFVGKLRQIQSNKTI